MSIFRKHKSIVDRSATDRGRHKKKIEKAIKESIRDVIADESIIGQNGTKKIRIPVRGLKEYRFVYGSNEKNKTVGSGGGHKVKRGQKIGKKRTDQAKGQGTGKASDQKGDEYYDVEISLAELAEYLFNDLQLPDLEKKQFKFVSHKTIKRKGYRFKGIRPRLSKKETLKRKIRRQKIAEKLGTYDPENGRFPFHQDDMKYHHIKPKIKENSAAVIFFLMDVSGSMSQDRKYLARSFFFLLYQFLNHKYEKVDVVFISHSTHAARVSEDDFFKVGTFGGTIISSALNLELDIIEKEYHPNTWNIYSFYCGDGENWSSDNEKSLDLFKKIKDVSQLTAYAEINEHYSNFADEEKESIMPDGYPWPSFSAWKNEEMDNLWSKLAPMCDSKFKKVMIGQTAHIWEAFNGLFGGGK
tara:strand:+ start:1890 stop:3125 length:1236 start_codon:yes stop_codon:yes gene_type:complete